MKKVVAALAACLLVACNTAPERSISLPLGRPVVEVPARQSMVFIVDAAADPLFVEGAERFAEAAAALTGQMFTVEVRSSPDALADFLRGEGDLVFLDSRKNTDFSSDLAVLAEPLRYADCDQMTMALNSQRMLAAVSDSLTDEGKDMRLLGAFYLGADYFVTSQPLSRGFAASSRLETRESQEDDPDADLHEDDSEEPRPIASLKEGSPMAPFMEELGLESITEPGMNARLYNVVEGSVAIAEFGLDELARIDWQDSSLNLVTSNHNMRVAWIAVRAGRWQELPDKYRAVLQESVARLYPVLDDQMRARQTGQITVMREAGMTVDTGFAALRQAADAIYAEEAPYSQRKEYLLEIISGME